jgi:hypothetical protein
MQGLWTGRVDGLHSRRTYRKLKTHQKMPTEYYYLVDHDGVKLQFYALKMMDSHSLVRRNTSITTGEKGVSVEMPEARTLHDGRQVRPP